MRDRFTEIAAAAEREQLSYLGFLAELVMAECDDRDRRRAARRVREAGFPRPKRLEEFSFDADPAVSPAVTGQLATCGWVKAGHPLICEVAASQDWMRARLQVVTGSSPASS
jgi:DNA replication protein DnaC